MVVLEVGVVGLTYRGNTQGHQVAFGMGGITLEIPVQPALTLGHCQAVIRLREVVHADVFVAGLEQAIDGVVQNGQFLLGGGQCICQNPGLRVEAIRQVSVAEH